MRDEYGGGKTIKKQLKKLKEAQFIREFEFHRIKQEEEKEGEK